MVSMKPCSRGVHSMCTPMISSLEHACMPSILDRQDKPLRLILTKVSSLLSDMEDIGLQARKRKG